MYERSSSKLKQIGWLWIARVALAIMFLLALLRLFVYKPPKALHSIYLKYGLSQRKLTSKKYYLVNCGIYFNEKANIREWVAHYIRQGVDHIFLVNSGPKEDLTRFALSVEIRAGLVTILGAFSILFYSIPFYICILSCS
jgi:hypothetical protein